MINKKSSKKQNEVFLSASKAASIDRTNHDLFEERVYSKWQDTIGSQSMFERSKSRLWFKPRFIPSDYKNKM